MKVGDKNENSKLRVATIFISINVKTLSCKLCGAHILDHRVVKNFASESLNLRVSMGM